MTPSAAMGLDFVNSNILVFSRMILKCQTHMNISLKLRVDVKSMNTEDEREVCNMHMEIEMSGIKL